MKRKRRRKRKRVPERRVMGKRTMTARRGRGQRVRSGRSGRVQHTRKGRSRQRVRRAAALNKALIAGRAVASHQHIIDSKQPNGTRSMLRLNWFWNQWFKASGNNIFPWKSYCELARHYVHGFSEQSGLHGHDWLLVPTNKKVGAIVTVMNEEAALPAVLTQLKRLPLHEMIVVVNGSTDNSLQIIREQSEAMIVHYNEALGHDIGRAIGAKLCRCDIMLFLDGDFPVSAELLIPFIHAVENGHDVVLNDISPYIQRFNQRDAVTIVKDFVNRSLGREALRANSLSAVPHALSRRAVETIGYQSLAVPPKAQAKAFASGLSFSSPASVDVIAPNKQRNQLNTGRRNPVANLIVGDHIEALATLMDAHGTRLNFTDHIRNRALLRRKLE